MIATFATSSKIVVEKSTVPVKAAESISKVLRANQRVGVSFEVCAMQIAMQRQRATNRISLSDRFVVTLGAVESRILGRRNGHRKSGKSGSRFNWSQRNGGRFVSVRRVMFGLYALDTSRTYYRHEYVVVGAVEIGKRIKVNELYNYNYYRVFIGAHVRRRQTRS